MQRRLIRFTPVPTKARHDGWTAARQFRFIDILAATRSITRACRAVGMSTVTAYALRKRPGAESFAKAWDAAVALAPDLTRARSPRAAQRLARFAARRSKANEVTEMYDPPGRPPPPGQASSASQALTTLQTYLAQLRMQEEGSMRGG